MAEEEWRAKVDAEQRKLFAMLYEMRELSAGHLAACEEARHVGDSAAARQEKTTRQLERVGLAVHRLNARMAGIIGAHEREVQREAVDALERQRLRVLTESRLRGLERKVHLEELRWAKVAAFVAALVLVLEELARHFFG